MMNDDQRLPTDDAIERGLARRAPHGPEAALLAGVMADVVATPQVTRWGPAVGGPGALGRRRAALLAVAAAVSLIAVAALAGGFGSRPPLPAVVDDTSPAATGRPTSSATPTSLATTAPTATPAAIAVATASPTGTQTCSSYPLVATADPSGSVTSTNMTFDGLGKGRMAYLTRTGSPNGDEIDVWVVSHGAKVATRIATFTAVYLDVGRVGDWTPGVPDLLVSIGALGDPYCSDLFLLAPDGSSLRRLTDEPTMVEIGASRLSPDGSHVAFEELDTDPNASSTSIIVRSVSDAKDPQVLTGSCFDPIWSSDSQKVAARCRAEDGTGYVELYERSNSSWTRAGDVPGGEEATAIAWSPDDRHIVAVLQPPLDAPCPFDVADSQCTNSRASAEITSASLDTRSGSWTTVPRSTSVGARPAAGSVIAISPDLHHVVVRGSCCKMAWTDVVDLRDGSVDPLGPHFPFGWSLDSAKLLSDVRSGVPGGRTLQAQLLDGKPFVDSEPAERLAECRQFDRFRRGAALTAIAPSAAIIAKIASDQANLTGPVSVRWLWTARGGDDGTDGARRHLDGLVAVVGLGARRAGARR